MSWLDKKESTNSLLQNILTTVRTILGRSTSKDLVDKIRHTELKNYILSLSEEVATLGASVHELNKRITTLKSVESERDWLQGRVVELENKLNPTPKTYKDNLISKISNIPLR